MEPSTWLEEEFAPAFGDVSFRNRPLLRARTWSSDLHLRPLSLISLLPSIPRLGLVSTDCDQPALTIRPSCWRAVTPSSRPTSSTILPFLSFNTVVPVKCIFRPVAAGNDPTRKSLNAEPVCVPPPSQRPTT